jgi:glycosyltransferase involved in cell wall biosynthesis
VEPHLGPDVEFLEELAGDDKYDMLGRAAGFLFPLQWEEPFGMVLIEAMACGTPVLSLRRGAVPEVVVDGVTGYVREHADELVEAIDHLPDIDPRACRDHVERNFSVARMVDGYEQAYRDCITGTRTSSGAVTA